MGGVKPPLHFHCVLHEKRGREWGVQLACKIVCCTVLTCVDVCVDVCRRVSMCVDVCRRVSTYVNVCRCVLHGVAP